MTERPSLEFRGRRYERRQSRWIDSATQMLVPVAQSLELDATAKRDPNLWERCLHSDFADNPKNRGAILYSDSFDLGPSSGSSQEPLPPYEPKPHRRVTSSHGLDLRFTKRRELIGKCDVEAGWRQTERSWRFGASETIDISGGWALRCSVTVAENTSGHWHRRFGGERSEDAPDVDDCDVESFVPRFPSLAITRGPIELSAEDTACTFIVLLLDEHLELNQALPWMFSGGKWSFRIYESGVYEKAARLLIAAISVSRPLNIQFKATLHPPPPAQRDPIYEHDTPLPSAGLPSLGKRR